MTGVGVNLFLLTFLAVRSAISTSERIVLILRKLAFVMLFLDLGSQLGERHLDFDGSSLAPSLLLLGDGRLQQERAVIMSDVPRASTHSIIISRLPIVIRGVCRRRHVNLFPSFSTPHEARSSIRRGRRMERNSRKQTQAYDSIQYGLHDCICSPTYSSCVLNFPLYTAVPTILINTN